MWFPHFKHGQHAMNMNRYTNAELVDIHFIYDLANGNGRVAVRLHGQHMMNMSHCMSAELADIHFIYGLANGSGCAAVWLYGERYPTRWQWNHQTFTRLHQNLAKHGSFRVTIDDTPVNSEMDLVARISIASATIRETHGLRFAHAFRCNYGSSGCSQPLLQVCTRHSETPSSATVYEWSSLDSWFRVLLPLKTHREKVLVFQSSQKVFVA
ncbi:hypothetical protein TNCV_4202641 [Trichonephila clavipes]|uniref:Uncharacterized protein n=1 Tax=Trichonephila clavipes TaxID=2585209 RepID=A0A8X6SHC1_TRICX|nr:hypothetical protein TNCV_4202641 [Trichonephila clavipes]